MEFQSGTKSKSAQTGTLASERCTQPWSASQDLQYAARHTPKSWIRDSRYLVPGAGYWGELDRLQPPGWDVFSHAAGAARGSHSSDRPRRFDARVLARLLGPPRRPPCIYRRN